jgi:hypothetical protein
MAQEVDPLEAEMGPQCLDVGDVVGRCVGAPISGRIGAACSARVEQHERPALPEAGEVAEVAGGESRAARVAQKERPFPL